MTKNSKFLLTIGAGILAGAAAGYYLNSEAGRKRRTDTSRAIKEKSSQALSKANEYAGSVKSAVTNLSSQAKNTWSRAADKLDTLTLHGHDGMEREKSM